MSLSRWKMMAGVLGVSIGGLAAAASQCPKFDSSKGRSAEAPVAKSDTKLPPAGPPAVPAAAFDVAALPTPPAPASGLPGTPSLPAAPAPMAGLPNTPAPTEALPPLPDSPAGPSVPAAKAPKPAEAIHPDKTLPPFPAPATPSAPTGVRPLDLKPPTAQPFLTPTPSELPPPPVATPSKPKSAPLPDQAEGGFQVPLNNNDPLPIPTGSSPTPKADPLPPATGFALPDSAHFNDKMIKAGPIVNVGANQSGAPVAAPQPPAVDVPLSKPTFAPAPAANAPAVAETKFRILLRVGEGEPTFEVKNGDNLVLKVACEKVDIESVEKNNGLSKVTARGKVRFAGFGAEGSCDSLSFMAGTGEVSMTGDVKVQVKDKLGRVESELTTAAMKYKIDASSVGSALKP